MSRSHAPPSARRAARTALRFARAVAAGLLLSGATAVAASGAPASGPPAWPIAPAGACARIEPVRPCLGSACRGTTSVRSRFDATDVASAGPDRDGGPAPPPSPIRFRGPGPCGDPSSPCGQSQPSQIPDPPPVGPPTGVIEQPTTPGSLPGLP